MKQHLLDMFAFNHTANEKMIEDIIGYDGGHWAAPLKDIALQLIFHSFHHRAQIQILIREEGKEPRFIDYIGDKYWKIQ